MNRPVAAFLSLVLLIIVAPATVLGARPPDPAISAITVTSEGVYSSTTGSCQLRVATTFNTWHGVKLVKFSQTLNGTVNSTPTAAPARKALTASYDFRDLATTSRVQYRVDLLNRAGVSVASATATEYTYAGSCPAIGTLIASYTAS